MEERFYNLKQNIEEKYRKLGKIGFSVKRLDFEQVSGRTVKTFIFSGFFK